MARCEDIRLNMKKWIPITEEEIILTNKYKYILGYYSHKEYGDKCFRVSKYLKENNYFIGHFVIVNEDMGLIGKAIIEQIKGEMDDIIKRNKK